MYLLFIYGAVRNGFEAGKDPLQEALKGVVPGNRDFLGPEMATSEASAI